MEATMPYTLDSALDDDLITVVNRNDSMGLYEVRIGTLKKIVSIELGRFLDSEWTKFDISHAIKTPALMSPYRTSRPFADYPAYALHQAISGLTQYYRQAVENGDKPDENWLVKN
jgi:hypothetical protein